MLEISILFLLLGVGILSASLRPINKICSVTAFKGWCVLRSLVVLFILGYIAYFLFLVTQKTAAGGDLLVSSIMLAGSIFVILVNYFSKHSILKINTLVVTERHNSLHDNLTGLPNRNFFGQHMAECQQAGSRHLLCILDLNGFKQINDGIGHHYGDQVLKAFASQVLNGLSDGIQLFRFGGDEFLIIGPYTTEAELTELAAQIHQNLDQELTFDGYTLKIGVSIGAIFFQGYADHVDDLLKKADAALYVSKREKTSYCLFDDTMISDSKERLAIASQLGTAIAEKQFEIHYQPIISDQTGCVAGAEALIRWPQANGGFISPDQFIPVAEQSRVINQITEYVFEQVANDCKTLKALGLNLDFHINLSVRDIQGAYFPEKITSLIQAGRINPENIMLEITESAMLTNLDRARETMQKLSEMGLVFSVDDFGTGFSSLSLLRHLPIQQIKIDRSFVKNILSVKADQAIVKSTIHLAHNLSCSVVAEGVEDEQSALLLHDLDCDYLQGYYFSKPLPLHAFIEFTQTYNQTNSLISGKAKQSASVVTSLNPS